MQSSQWAIPIAAGCVVHRSQISTESALPTQR